MPWLRSVGVVALLVSLGASEARAEPPAATEPYLVLGPVEREAAEAFLARRGIAAVPLAEQPDRAELTRADLAPLESAEKSLLEARALGSRFAEADALLVLVRAEQALLERGLELPFAHALLAELNVQIAVLAWTLGEPGLADTALRRAATLDPERRLRAGEAPPDLVARARDIERARDGAGRARVELRADGAVLALDGVALGASPAQIAVAPGTHVLVARAPGRTPYAGLIELESGERAPVELVLAETELARSRADLLRAGDALEAEAKARRLSTLSTTPIWLFEADTTARRATVKRCTSEACVLAGGWAFHSELPRAASEHRPVWKRWPFWLAVSGGVLAASALSVWAAHDERTRSERVLRLDPGNPAPAR